MYNYNYSSSSVDLDSLGFATLGAMLGVYIVVILVVAVLQIIAMWKIFTKAGEKGWKSIIPIYNVITLFKISGISPWLVLVYLASIIPFVGWIAVIAINIYQANCLSKSFGKDVGYTVGLIFLPVIFYMILGFGSSQYTGTIYGNTSSSSPVTENNDNNSEV